MEPTKYDNNSPMNNNLTGPVSSPSTVPEGPAAVVSNSTSGDVVTNSWNNGTGKPTPEVFELGGQAAEPRSSLQTGKADEPTAVVKVLSVRGLEYLMMTIALWAGAFSLTGIVLSLVNSGTSFEVLAFPVSVLIVSVSLFSFFFLRLKRAELNNPSFRFDPSKRRLSQITQVIAYIACFASLIGIVYSILAKVAGSLDMALWKIVLDFVVVIIVAGGILVYYWVDEHRER